MKNDSDTGFAQGEAVLGVENTVLIMNHIYPKTRSAYLQTLEGLQDGGYSIPDHAKIKAGEDEKEALFFTLGDIGAAECGSCDSVISSRGVKVHNHPCECCGQPTCVTYRKGGAIRFRFIGADGRYVGNDISFRIYGYNEHEEGDWNDLLLYAAPLLKDYTEPTTGRSLRIGLMGVDSEAEAQNLLEEAARQKLYRRSLVIDPETGQDVPVIILKHHKSRLLQKGSVFDTAELVGGIDNHRLIKIWNGRKYGDWDKLPVPETLHLSRRYMNGFKHSLAEPNIHETIMGAAGQVSRADYYHQEGRAAFGREAFERMSHFVNHCVDVPFAEWQDFLSGLKGRIQKPQSLSGDFGAYVFNSVRGGFGASGRYQNISGPDFIYALAEWAGKMSDGRRKKVRDEPNIGNALEGVWKIINGQTLGAAEAAAMMEGAETPDMKAFGDSLKRSAAEKKKAARRAQQWRKNADNRNWGDTSSDPPDQAPEPDSP